MVFGPKSSLLRGLPTILVGLALLQTLPQAWAVPKNPSCEDLVINAISGVDDNTQRLLERALPFVESDVLQIMRLKKARALNPIKGDGLINTYVAWMQNPSTELSQKILIDLDPVIQSAMIQFIHRLSSADQWEDVVQQVRLDILRIMERTREDYLQHRIIPHNSLFGSGSHKVWITQRIRRYMSRKSSDTGVVFNQGAVGAPLYRTTLEQELLHDGYTLKEIALIAERRKMSFEDILGQMGALRVTAAFLNPFDFTVEISDESSAVDGQLDENDLKALLGNALAALSPREELVLRLRFGFYETEGRSLIDLARDIGVDVKNFPEPGAAPLKLVEVGDLLGVTRERIRQLEMKAFRKLSHPSRSKDLRPFLPSWNRTGTLPANGNRAQMSDAYVQQLAEKAMDQPEMLASMSPDLRKAVEPARNRQLRERLLRELYEARPVERADLERISQIFYDNRSIFYVRTDRIFEHQNNRHRSAHGMLLQLAFAEHLAKLHSLVDELFREERAYLARSGDPLADDAWVVDEMYMRPSFDYIWINYGRLILAAKLAEATEQQWREMNGLEENQFLTPDQKVELISVLKPMLENINGYDGRRLEEALLAQRQRSALFAELKKIFE